jgi:hypothetical protein
MSVMLTELVTRSLTFESASDAYDHSRYDWPVNANVPEPYRSVLEALAPDDGMCSCCERQSVGQVLLVDDETGHDRGAWRWLTIATDGDKTWLLCEECSASLVAPYVPKEG